MTEVVGVFVRFITRRFIMLVCISIGQHVIISVAALSELFPFCFRTQLKQKFFWDENFADQAVYMKTGLSHVVL
jgi:hypothetical protein